MSVTRASTRSAAAAYDEGTLRAKSVETKSRAAEYREDLRRQREDEANATGLRWLSKRLRRESYYYQTFVTLPIIDGWEAALYGAVLVAILIILPYSLGSKLIRGFRG